MAQFFGNGSGRLQVHEHKNAFLFPGLAVLTHQQGQQHTGSVFLIHLGNESDHQCHQPVIHKEDEENKFPGFIGNGRPAFHKDREDEVIEQHEPHQRHQQYQGKQRHHGLQQEGNTEAAAAEELFLQKIFGDAQHQAVQDAEDDAGHHGGPQFRWQGQRHIYMHGRVHQVQQQCQYDIGHYPKAGLCQYDIEHRVAVHKAAGPLGVVGMEHGGD